MKYGIKFDMPNETYHANDGFLSSSRIKMILQSPEMYYKKYILKELKSDSCEAFDTGTAIHTRILEPNLFEREVTFFSGRKQGIKWEEFQEKNKGKVILGDIQKIQIERMYKAYLESKIAPPIMEGGESEVSLYTQLDGFDIKVRADRLHIEKGLVIDLKSTSGLIEKEKFRYNLESRQYGYDLSAALYVDAFSKYYNQKFEFIWIVLSKDFNDIKCFKATPNLIEQGRKKYKEAFKLITEYSLNNWDFSEKIIDIGPSNNFLGE